MIIDSNARADGPSRHASNHHVQTSAHAEGPLHYLRALLHTMCEDLPCEQSQKASAKKCSGKRTNGGGLTVGQESDPTSTCPLVLTCAILGGEAHANHLRSPFSSLSPGCSSTCFTPCQFPKRLSLHRTMAVRRRACPTLTVWEPRDAAPPAADHSMETFRLLP